jgi:ribulose-bisphosphate carboxylase large chain
VPASPGLTVTYLLTGPRDECVAVARDLCIEQTIEFPADLVTRPEILDHVVARADEPVAVAPDLHEVRVEFSAEIIGSELTQLLNVLFGNISLKRGIRVQRIELGDPLLSRFRGPRFGRPGLRRLLQAPGRPLLCSALKPLGLSAAELADLAYRFALGGMDMIKDDHGLADQPFAPFRERVARCAEAVAKANAVTGGRCLYLPNVTAPAGEVIARALLARSLGASGLLVSPGLVGFDAMRLLAEDERLGLPILMHPALLGSFVISPVQGISHRVLFGQLARLAGADGVIFPNFGGRFSFTPADCRDFVDGTVCPMANLAPALPVPAGGMSLARVPEMVEFYGRDVILLIGGDLHRDPRGLVESCRTFRRLVE